MALGDCLLVLGDLGEGLKDVLVAVDVGHQQMALVDDRTMTGTSRGRIRLLEVEDVVAGQLDVVSSAMKLVALLDEETSSTPLVGCSIGRHCRPDAVLGELRG